MHRGVACAGEFIDEVGVEMMFTQAVAAPHLILRVREEEERDENRQGHSGVDIQRGRKQPKRT